MATSFAVCGFSPGSVNFVPRPRKRTLTKKYRPERKGRRSIDTAIQYVTVNTSAREKTRTTKPVVRAI